MGHAFGERGWPDDVRETEKGAAKQYLLEQERPKTAHQPPQTEEEKAHKKFNSLMEESGSLPGNLSKNTNT